MSSIFPTFPGLTWSTSKAPQFKTQVQTGVSRRELRLTYSPVPTWLFTLKFDFLRDAFDVRGGAGLGSGFNELRTLMGFFQESQGQLTPFRFFDPTDNQIVGQVIGTGDATTTAFQLLRTLTQYATPFNEPILAPNIVSAIYINGIVQATTGYTVNANTGIVTFVSAPPNAAVITADFSYYFLCRFADDTLSFENFMYRLWSLKELRLQSILI